MNSTSDMFYGASPEIFRRAENLRKRMTESEKLLWEKLKKYRRTGFKFRRQHPMGPFIADFYCHRAKLVVELDGRHHQIAEVKMNDEIRKSIINSWGINVIRFNNVDVLTNLESVVQKIESYIFPPAPLP
jgi:cyclase